MAEPFQRVWDALRNSPGVLANPESWGGNVGTRGDNFYGYPVRNNLHAGEMAYFRSNPHVTGMASEDQSIIFNPFSTINSGERDAVGRNEALRLHMRANNYKPTFAITPEQRSRFAGTDYANDDNDLRHTILGRAFSGDPSAGDLTDEQKRTLYEITEMLNRQVR